MRGKILNLNINAPNPLIIKLRSVNKNKGSPSFSTMKNQYRDTEIPASEIFPLQNQYSTEILNSVTGRDACNRAQTEITKTPLV